MRIYQLTNIGESEANAPVGNPSPAQRVLYFLRKRNNRAASDDMIANEMERYDIGRGETQVAMSRLVRARAVRVI